MPPASLSAVYCITHLDSGRVYVGSAANLKQRWYSHRRDLTRGKHRNEYLQRAWMRYGADRFSFTVLEEVTDPRDLIAVEQRHIDRLNAANRRHGFNIAPVAGSRLGIPCREETRARISAGNRGKVRSAEFRAHLASRRPSDETRRKLSIAGTRRRDTAETRKKRSEATRGVSRPWALRDECPKGHPKIGENLYVDPKGSRRCVKCKREQFAAFKARRAGAA